MLFLLSSKYLILSQTIAYKENKIYWCCSPISKELYSSLQQADRMKNRVMLFLDDGNICYPPKDFSFIAFKESFTKWRANEYLENYYGYHISVERLQKVGTACPPWARGLLTTLMCPGFCSPSLPIPSAPDSFFGWNTMCQITGLLRSLSVWVPSLALSATVPR